MLKLNYNCSHVVPTDSLGFLQVFRNAGVHQLFGDPGEFLRLRRWSRLLLLGLVLRLRWVFDDKSLVCFKGIDLHVSNELDDFLV